MNAQILSGGLPPGDPSSSRPPPGPLPSESPSFDARRSPGGLMGADIEADREADREAGTPDYLQTLKARTGTTLGTSGWVVMDQRRIDQFAEATGDTQFVHVDPVRAAAETPFGGTIAHGYLTLSMIGTFAAEVLPPHPAVRMLVNMGADKVRLLAPVRVNQRVRGVFVLAGVTALPDRKAALRARVTIEAAGPEAEAERVPVAVLTADLSLMLVLADPANVSCEMKRVGA